MNVTEYSTDELVVRSPASGEVLGTLPVLHSDQVDSLVGAARAAQKSWAWVPRHERYHVVQRYIGLLRQNAEELASLLASENGKPIGQAREEIENATRATHGYAERMIIAEEKAYFLDSDHGAENDLMLVKREPLGVVVAIAAFNYPTEIGTHKMVPALCMGNAVIIKPPEQDPLTLNRMVELFHDAGLPRNLLQVANGGAEVGQLLVEHPGVAAVSLTGSGKAGLSVAASGAKTLKRMLLELGGNDAFIVMADADLDVVTSEAIKGRIAANGQVCIANKRIIAQRDIADELVDRLTARAEEIVMGDPLRDTTELGPLIDVPSARRVGDQVSQTIAAGARVTTGGRIVDGSYFPATVLRDVTSSMDIARDMEVFGPVFPIITVSGAEEAVSVANASRYGLSGSVFCDNTSEGMRIASQLECGTVVVNGSGCYRVDPMPLGGYKFSGTTREGLSTSLDEYVQSKAIILKGMAGRP